MPGQAWAGGGAGACSPLGRSVRSLKWEAWKAGRAARVPSSCSPRAQVPLLLLW